MWKATFFGLAHGARMKHDVTLEHDAQAMVIMETIAHAGGFLNMTLGADAEINKACESDIWAPELSSKFTDRKVVGSGATACVWLGKDSTGTTVAIKVGKNSGGKGAGAALASWRSECIDMQLLRLDACKAGGATLKLHEHFIPTCTGVGPTKSGGAYYIMHAAGVEAFKDLPESGKSVSDRKALFAGFVASLYSMHSVGQTHNDLHGQNIVIDDGGDVALIDFGELKPPSKAWVEGYKRDDNAVWRWAEVLAECPQGNLWSTSFDQGYLMPAVAAATKKCLQAKWSPDAKFMKIFDVIMEGGMDKARDQNLVDLYNTPFVQNNLPAIKKKFPAAFADGCLSWSDQKLQDEVYKIQFSAHVKCDQIPSYTYVKTSTKRGKTRTRNINQCGGLQGACYKLAPGRENLWMCDGMAITRGSACTAPEIDGACLTNKHPAYKFAQEFSA